MMCVLWIWRNEDWYYSFSRKSKKEAVPVTRVQRLEGKHSMGFPRARDRVPGEEASLGCLEINSTRRAPVPWHRRVGVRGTEGSVGIQANGSTGGRSSVMRGGTGWPTTADCEKEPRMGSATTMSASTRRPVPVARISHLLYSNPRKVRCNAMGGEGVKEQVVKQRLKLPMPPLPHYGLSSKYSL